MQLQGKKIQNREIRIKRIDTRTNAKNVFNKSFDKRPVQFKRTKPSFNAKDFQGETMKSKSQKKVIKLLNFCFCFFFFCKSAFNFICNND